jgi:type VI secretion system secreted protein Hcp
MAEEFFVTVVGARQGVLVGDCSVPGREGAIAGVGFAYDVEVARNVATGLSTGKRRHQPVRITKRWDRSTPLLFRALSTNEAITEVVVEFPAPGGGGPYHRVRLANALVTEIRQHVDPQGGAHLEDVSFTFQHIEFTNLVTGATAEDDWAEHHGGPERAATASGRGEAGTHRT